MRWLIVVMLLASCAADQPPSVPPIALPLPPSPPPVIVTATPATTATREYRETEAKEARAVTKSSATPSSIRAVGNADILARDALIALIKQDGHPTKAAIAQAKRAREALDAAIEATPKQ
jgi:hypothetical protein